MEIAAVLRQAGFHLAPALLFEQVKGYPGRKIVGNLLGSRPRLAMALGVSEDEIKEEFLRRLDCPVEPQVVPLAPVQEEVHTANIDVTKMVPALVHHQGDAGPYLTCAFTLARDPETGARGMGLHRIQVKGPDRLGIFLATPPLSTFLARAEANNRPLEVAIVIGADPLTLLASVVWTPQGIDKLGVAGGLRQEPLLYQLANGGRSAGKAVFFHQTLVDAVSGVALFRGCGFILGQPFLDHLFHRSGCRALIPSIFAFPGYVLALAVTFHRIAGNTQLTGYGSLRKLFYCIQVSYLFVKVYVDHSLFYPLLL